MWVAVGIVLSVLIPAGFIYAVASLNGTLDGQGNGLPLGSTGDGITITSPKYLWFDFMDGSHYQYLRLHMNMTNTKEVAVLTSNYLMTDSYWGENYWFITTSDGITVKADEVASSDVPDRLSPGATCSFYVDFLVPKGLSITSVQYLYDGDRFNVLSDNQLEQISNNR